MANFIKRFLYMVASTQPPAVLPNQIDNSTVSGVGFFKGRFQFQQSTAPVAQPEVPFWQFAWSEPVRQRISGRLAIALTVSGLVAPVFTTSAINPTFTAETTSISSPVSFQNWMIYESEFEPVTVPVAETVTVDKWIYPWTDPVRQKIGLKTNLQQSFIGLTLNPDTQISQNFESRWHFPWSEPVRTRAFNTALQSTTAAPTTVISAPVTEVVTAAIWSQVTFTKYLIYQSVARPVFTPAEVNTVDKWVYPWSEPVRQKIGLRADLQQSFIGLTLNPDTQITQNYESRWHYAWSEPVRIRPQVPAGEQQTLIQGPVQTPEFITVDKWIYPWTDPVRLRIGLKTHLQQALIAPVLNPETQITQDIESRWHYPWSEPVRIKRPLLTAQQQSVAYQSAFFETINIDKWGYAWSEPVRQKIGLKANLQQAFIGLTLEPNTQIIQTYESRWHQPWSEPVRRKPSVANQPSISLTPFVAEVVTLDKWLYPLNEPVRIKRGLLAALQQSFATTTVVLPAIIETSAVAGQPIFKTRFSYQFVTAPVFTPSVESITYDKWGYAWSEPVRFKIDKQRAIALAAPAAIGPVLNPNTQITQFFESRWHFAWSEPKRFKPGLGAWLQQATILQTPPEPTLLKTIPWFEALNEPVRLKRGLLAGLQHYFETDLSPPPAVGITLVLSATEVNSDSAFFGVTSYNQVAPVIVPATQTVVSIKEIEAVRVADASVEEQPAYDSADVSMKEQ